MARRIRGTPGGWRSGMSTDQEEGCVDDRDSGRWRRRNRRVDRRQEGSRSRCGVSTTILCRDPGLARGLDRDRHHGNLDRGRRPTDGHDPSGREVLPNTLRRTSVGHNVLIPSEHLGTAAESSIRRATCTYVSCACVLPDTNIRPPTHIPVRKAVVERRK